VVADGVGDRGGVFHRLRTAAVQLAPVGDAFAGVGDGVFELLVVVDHVAVGDCAPDDVADEVVVHRGGVRAVVDREDNRASAAVDCRAVPKAAHGDGVAVVRGDGVAADCVGPRAFNAVLRGDVHRSGVTAGANEGYIRVAHVHFDR